MTNVIDEKELMERVDGDLEFLGETIEMLDEDSPALLDQIRRAVESADAGALARSAHALKGMLANFCATAAEAAAVDLERVGREDRLEDAAAAADLAIRETVRAREALQEFLRRETS